MTREASQSLVSLLPGELERVVGARSIEQALIAGSAYFGVGSASGATAGAGVGAAVAGYAGIRAKAPMSSMPGIIANGATMGSMAGGAIGGAFGFCYGAAKNYFYDQAHPQATDAAKGA
jgi:hypothetical protein